MVRSVPVVVNYDLLEERSDAIREAMPGFSIPQKSDRQKIGYQKQEKVLATHVTSDHIPSPVGFETINARVARHNASIEAKAMHQYWASNKMPIILSGVPETLAINDLDSLSSGHVVWYDKNTGIVQCILSTKDKVGLKWWRMYFSDYPQYIETRGNKFVAMCDWSDHGIALIHNGEVIRWGRKSDVMAFMSNNRNLFNNPDDNWDITRRGPVFPELRFNRPSTTNLSRVAVVHALYSNHK